MKFFLVDVVCITSAKSCEEFDKTKVNELADSILESDGLLKPLVLKATGPESFEVIDGYLQYWAAVRAREKDSRKGEMVNAFVIAPRDEEMIVKQLRTLQSQAETSSSAPVIESDEKSSYPKDISTNILQAYKKDLENINRKIDVLVSLPSQLTEMIQKLEQHFQEKIESVNGWLKQLENKPEPVKTVAKKGYVGNNVRELRLLAVERGIKVSSKLLKAGIIAALEEYDKKNETKTSHTANGHNLRFP
jgi:hypothetical protein